MADKYFSSSDPHHRHFKKSILTPVEAAATLIKSRDPHLEGREKWYTQVSNLQVC